jgi:hypothetical protein
LAERTRLASQLPLVATLGGAAALALYVAKLPHQHARALAALAVALLVGILDLTGRAVGARGRAASLACGVEVAWPAALVLSATPAALRWPAVLGGHLAALVGAGACLVLAWQVDRVSPTRIPLVAVPARGRRIGTWEIALLAVAVAISALYIEIGAGAQGHLQNDSAYYFGVAKHLAVTGRFEEPIVWHFVHAPKTIAHAPFDYWGGLTSLVLAPVLAIFGPTQHTAFVAMAVISGLSVVAFWYLVCVALPIRYPAVQLLALVAFAFSFSARDYRFDTESLPLHHLVQTIALIGLATARHRLALVAAFLLVLSRVDGVILFAATAIVVAVQLRRDRPALRRAGLLAGGLVAAYVARNLWSFRSLTPPGASAGLTMTGWNGSTSLGLLHAPSTSLWSALAARLEFANVADRFDVLVNRSLRLAMLPGQQLWYLLAIAGIVCARPRRRVLLIPGAAFFIAYVFVWGSGTMFHNWRTLSAILPLLVLGAADGLCFTIDGIVALTRRARRHRRSFTLVATAAVLALAYPIATRVQPYGPRERAETLPKEMELSQLDRLLDGRPVLTPEPWYIIARTRSPAVSLPNDGAEAVVEVIRRYGVEWIVILDEKSTWRSAFGAAAKSKDKSYEGVVLERVPTPGTIALFKVVRR